MVFSANLYAQQHVYVVTSPIANTIPFNSSISQNFRQYVYYPSDFPTATPGLITDLYIKSSSAVTPNFSNLTVKMGYVAFSTFPSGNYITGLQTVYTGAYNQATVVGNYVKITLQTPFVYTNTQNFVVEFSQLGYSPGFNVNQASVPQRSVYGAATGTSGGIQDRLADFGFDLLPGGDGYNNAGLADLISPYNFCASTQEVKVKVRNYGTNILNTLQIQWSMDGVMQTPVNITTPIDTFGSVGGNERDVVLGNYAFPSTPIAFKAWTTFPNGGVDTINWNDTLSMPLAATNYTLTSSSDTICANGSASLSLTPSTGFAPNALTWQQSTDGGLTWTNITGVTG
ncbi:MAG TPA: hypothetical protein VLZ83_14490, partial [Edaphocola sp.]|nr:hypothetical protein [Edaphocola sp.]